MIESQEVVVKDIQMPFWSMVVFMVKWAIAAVPAFLILMLVASLAWTGLMLTGRSDEGELDPTAGTAFEVPTSGESTHRDAAQNDEPQDRLRYISEFIELSQVQVGRQGRYGLSDLEPVISSSVRNLGDRSVARLEVTVYFLGADGSPIAEKAFSPISGYSLSDSSPLRPGYVRDFSYFVTDDAPASWGGGVTARVTNLEFECAPADQSTGRCEL